MKENIKKHAYYRQRVLFNL